MEKSKEDDPISPPDSKRPRRVVQSKLSWHKPRAEEVKSMGEGQEDGTIEGEGKKKRKSRIKAPRKSPAKTKEARGSSTSTKRNNNCQLKNDQTGETTPKKAQTPTDCEPNASSSKKRLSNKRTGSKKDGDGQHIIQHPMADLLLEAKIAAEENVRLYAGKQTHPFFTSRKVAKKLYDTQETTKSRSKCWPSLDGDYLVSLPPVHVFDKLEDDITLLDWRNWAFIETAQFDLNGFCTLKNNYSVFKGSVKPLKFDTLCHRGIDLNQLLDKPDGYLNGANSTLILSDEQDTNGQQILDTIHTSGKNSLASRCFSHVASSSNEPQDGILKERLASYHERISCWPECSLWTEKYQPENAVEACGNSESIKFLNEWLKSWHERGTRSRQKINTMEQEAIEDVEDSMYSNESDMDDSDDEDALKNVLLITGPIGSGKSAAIYACAKEQGFEVIEVNASDSRSGAHIKQKFGEAMESHGLNKWSVEDPNGPRRKELLELLSSPADIREEDEFRNGSFEMASITQKQEATPNKSLWDARENRSARYQVANKTLILFEEVDTIFDEDRGFLSTILQLAETAKRPIVLTSNCKDPFLPHHLDRHVLNFRLPLSEELLSHLDMICASEKACVSSGMLAHLVRSCVGDIRKSLMLLQFWCQGKILHTDRNTQCKYDSLPFDIDAVHLIIPRMIPWGLPCKLSEKVGEEIDRTLAMLEDKLPIMEMEWMEVIDPPKKKKAVAKPRKKGLLKKTNHSFLDSSEPLDHANGLEDFVVDSDSPANKHQRRAKHRPCLVLSSQSDDGSADYLHDTDAICQMSNIVAEPVSQTPEVLDLLEQQMFPINRCQTDNACQFASETFEALSTSHICETLKSQDVSCVPESYFISGTETNKEDGFPVSSSNNASVSSVHFISRPIDVLARGDLNNLDLTVIDLNRCLDDNNADGTCEVDAESVSGNEELRSSQNKDEGPSSSRHRLMDECSQAEFNMELVLGKNWDCPPGVDLVQETWRKLRYCHEDLKSSLPANREDVSLMVKLTSGLIDLISEADILFGGCIPLINDVLDPSMTRSVEPDDFSWYDKQYEMGSTYAQHGLCLYKGKCSAVGSILAHENSVDLAEEMLSSSTNCMALGKLLSSSNNSSQNSCLESLNKQESGCGIPIGRESESALRDAILPIVPARLSMALRGHAFHEYSSFMSKISRLECSRISKSMEGSNKRYRTRRHYLSSGPLSLSPEHVEMLAQSNFKRNGRVPSFYMDHVAELPPVLNLDDQNV